MTKPMDIVHPARPRRRFKLPLDFGVGPRLERPAPRPQNLRPKPPEPLWSIALREREGQQ